MNEQARRAWAMEELRLLEERIATRNSNFTDEQIEAMAVRTGRQINLNVHDE